MNNVWGLKLMHTNDTPVFADSLAASLPFLRRYARALTGSQPTGDRYAAATLEAIVESSDDLGAFETAKIALFHAFHLVWTSAGSPIGEADTRLSGRAQDHMANLTPNSREALLLHAIEGFSETEIAAIMAIEKGIVHPTINQFDPDPECDLNTVPNKAVSARVDKVLVNNFGFGGHNGVLAIERLKD